MRPLLILRPEPGNASTTGKAKALGLDVKSIPLFTPEALAWSAPSADQFEAILFTSANAIRLAGSDLGQYENLAAYCVGHATADTARLFGLPVAWVGNGGVDETIAAAAGKKLLHLCGEDRVEPSCLNSSITPIVCYRMAESNVSSALPSALEQNPIALLHSPRAARRFSSLVVDKSKIALCALSPAIVGAAGDGWEDVAISPQPRDDALINTALTHFNITSNQGRLND